MIKKMTKYSFVVFHKEVEDFLGKLQEIGVVDVTRQKRAIDSYSMEQFEEIARCNAAVSALNRLKGEAQKKGLEIPVEKPVSDNLLELYSTLVQKRDALKTKLFNLKGEYANALPWGAFTQENFKALENLSLVPYFYSVSALK
mgnify:CR=1 FL=1